MSQNDTRRCLLRPTLYLCAAVYLDAFAVWCDRIVGVVVVHYLVREPQAWQTRYSATASRVGEQIGERLDQKSRIVNGRALPLIWKASDPDFFVRTILRCTARETA